MGFSQLNRTKESPVFLQWYVLVSVNTQKDVWHLEGDAKQSHKEVLPHAHLHGRKEPDLKLALGNTKNHASLPSRTPAARDLVTLNTSRVG